MPGPLSEIASTSSVPCRCACSLTSPASSPAVASAPLRKRLTRICSILSGAVSASSGSGGRSSFKRQPVSSNRGRTIFSAVRTLSVRSIFSIRLSPGRAKRFSSCVRLAMRICRESISSRFSEAVSVSPFSRNLRVPATNMRKAASGWLSSWTTAADISPTAARRLERARPRCASRSSFSTRRRS